MIKIYHNISHSVLKMVVRNVTIQTVFHNSCSCYNSKNRLWNRMGHIVIFNNNACIPNVALLVRLMVHCSNMFKFPVWWPLQTACCPHLVTPQRAATVWWPPQCAASLWWPHRVLAQFGDPHSVLTQYCCPSLLTPTMCWHRSAVVPIEPHRDHHAVPVADWGWLQ